MKNQIGLNADYAKQINEKLNVFLSDVQIVYMNLRGYHWNIVGKHFFALHEKYEEIYDVVNDMADEIAERIIMLGGVPVHAYSKYIKMANIKEKENVITSEATIKEVIAELNQLLDIEREIIEFAGENGDEGTVDMVTGYISEQEKTIWMLNALLK
ncbi:MAG: DNA starvation/stationary phase protection protein [Bacteroidales bacterium]|jgi:starvation-inducible DNA-binding protein|nr:DNA starvation/stationary phase protection protein [Bacteroidales bacterium]MCK9499815.1 DNA starvation/stationary phase protection protein [Bacteroidales bacterium]MDY0316036.1 DNA starvation/stationary phase protection protein [Bacteroidales bacterium]